MVCGAASSRSQRCEPHVVTKMSSDDVVEDDKMDLLRSAWTTTDPKQNAMAKASAVAMSALIAITSPAVVTPPAMATLQPGDPIKNANTLLRNALPIDKKPGAKEIREVQRSLEAIDQDLKVPGVRFSGVDAKVKKAKDSLRKSKDALSKGFAPDKAQQGKDALDELQKGLESDFPAIIEAKDKYAVQPTQTKLLTYVSVVEESLVTEFPFQIPAEYSKMPALKGRAVLDVTLKLNDNKLHENGTHMMLVLDGYNAPITAGNFMDLVMRRFYDGMEIQRADGFVVQTGDPDGPAEGFIDPSTEALRTVPLEIMVKGDKTPVYGETLEENGRYNEDPAIPFNAYGTIAMARAEFEDNSGSSQFFWLLKESELTPSNANLLDGRYAVFGYLVENQDLLSSVQVGDTIESIKVVSGADLLENASYKVFSGFGGGNNSDESSSSS